MQLINLITKKHLTKIIIDVLNNRAILFIYYIRCKRRWSDLLVATLTKMVTNFNVLFSKC